MVQLLWKRVWQFLRKLDIHLTYDLAIMLHSIYYITLKLILHKNMNVNIYSNFIDNFQSLEATKMSFNI